MSFSTRITMVLVGNVFQSKNYHGFSGMTKDDNDTTLTIVTGGLTTKLVY